MSLEYLVVIISLIQRTEEKQCVYPQIPHQNLLQRGRSVKKLQILPVIFIHRYQKVKVIFNLKLFFSWFS